MLTDERLRELWHNVSGMPLMEGTRDFARAVEAETLEAAAKVCERDLVNRPDDPPANYFDGGLRHCAVAIRALTKGEGRHVE